MAFAVRPRVEASRGAVVEDEEDEIPDGIISPVV